jgi:hypothetical protein
MSESSMGKWQALTQPPGVVEFFQGLFDRVGVIIVETGEAFTGQHNGDEIEFASGINEPEVDFTVAITIEQVDRLTRHVGSGELGTAEEFRIVRTLFTPATRATLRNPMLSNNFLRWMNGVEDLIHVHLRSPVDEEEDVNHTLIHAAGQWVVIPGLHGNPRRVFDLTMADALEYHRRTIDAIHKDRFMNWLSFASWYKKWRKGVSKLV